MNLLFIDAPDNFIAKAMFVYTVTILASSSMCRYVSLVLFMQDSSDDTSTPPIGHDGNWELALNHTCAEDVSGAKQMHICLLV